MYHGFKLDCLHDRNTEHGLIETKVEDQETFEKQISIHFKGCSMKPIL